VTVEFHVLKSTRKVKVTAIGGVHRGNTRGKTWKIRHKSHTQERRMWGKRSIQGKSRGGGTKKKGKTFKRKKRERGGGTGEDTGKYFAVHKMGKGRGWPKGNTWGRWGKNWGNSFSLKKRTNGPCPV